MYVCECSDGSLYCGISPNPAKRIALHNAGKGAKYTRSRGPVRLLVQVRYPTRSEALKAERRFKKLTRAQKLERIEEMKSCSP